MYKTLVAPITIQWEITPWCNHRCLHCYNYWRTDEPFSRVAPPETLKIHQKAVEEIINNNIFSVVVTGGEPLGVFRQVRSMLQQLNKAGINLSLNSNLTLITDRMADQLRECGISHILTSLPSADPRRCDEITQSKGSLSRISKGTQLAISHGFQVSVNMVVMTINLNDIFITGEYVRNLGVTAFMASRAAPPANCPRFSYLISRRENELMLQELLRVRNELDIEVDSLEVYPQCSFLDNVALSSFCRRNCTAGRSYAAIGYDGQIRPCPRSSDTYGSVVSGFSEAWAKMDYYRGNSIIPVECESCPIRFKCMGGCKVDAFTEYKCYNKPDPLADPLNYPRLSKGGDNRKNSNIIDIFPLNKFKINPHIRLRKESFGGFVWFKEAIPINNSLFDLLNAKRGEFITREDLGQVLQVSPEQTILFLLKRQILIRKE
jgi:radical SAM protein with 4Fe4S-binding SPASM domain